MSPEIELDGKVYRLIGDDWYDAITFISAPKVIARELDARHRTLETTPSPQPQRKPSARETHSEDSAFSNAEVFPYIAQVIRDRCADVDDFVTHGEIVEDLLTHREARGRIEDAIHKKGHAASDWAHWMVQSFSAAITESRSPYQDAFERKRVEDRWAYRTAKS